MNLNPLPKMSIPSNANPGWVRGWAGWGVYLFCEFSFFRASKQPSFIFHGFSLAFSWFWWIAPGSLLIWPMVLYWFFVVFFDFVMFSLCSVCLNVSLIVFFSCFPGLHQCVQVVYPCIDVFCTFPLFVNKLTKKLFKGVCQFSDGLIDCSVFFIDFSMSTQD